ncbi:MAG: hypothetical protein HY913_08485 [Desulfomonile tiedjei]|nr:hypothetical protein [Desulfomonile tiedjei]
MITNAEESEILSRAYVPEHIVKLMTLVSGGEPFLFRDYFCCRKGDLVIFVGYPLETEFRVDELERDFNELVKAFRPAKVSLVSPELPVSFSKSCTERNSDYYYTLDLHATSIPPDARRAVRRAVGGTVVERGRRLGQSHHDLACEFVDRVDLPERVGKLLFGMWDYVGQAEDSLVLNAWGPGNKLAAFYVIDLSAKRFVTYVIGCHSKKNYVRGASDLLFLEMIRIGKELNKEYIHLGLGVNEGIRRFKKKWGGVPSRKYEMSELMIRKPSFLDAIVSYTTKP